MRIDMRPSLRTVQCRERQISTSLNLISLTEVSATGLPTPIPGKFQLLSSPFCFIRPAAQTAEEKTDSDSAFCPGRCSVMDKHRIQGAARACG